MLLYNKALDVNHTLLRMTSLLVSIDVKIIDVNALRMLDFLIANPAHIYKLSVPRDTFLDKKIFNSYKNRYQTFDPKGLFNAMKNIQKLVIERLVSIDVLKRKNDGSIYDIDTSNVPVELLKIIQQKDNSISNQAIDFIADNLVSLPVTGEQGLKKITNLMDYKYDVK